MAAALGFFLLGLFLLALGGDSIVRGASGLGRRLGLSPLATGVVLVAFGTSLPELAVNARAAWVGSQALALGNAVGSNVVNFGLTLGAAALAMPLLVRWRALVPLLLCFMLACVLVMLLGYDGALSRFDGGVLLAVFIAVLAWTLMRSPRETDEVQEAIEAFCATNSVLWLNLFRFLLAVVLLYFGARLVVEHAPVLGAALGLAPLLTGLVVVAVGTALPEMAGAIAAARRGHGDMVVGHVVGSSLFNLLVVVGGMAVFRDVPLPTSFVRFEVPAALAFALALYPMLRGDLRISKREGGVLLAAFLAWLLFELVLVRH
ncbi:MAG TPA: sodium:calcium antiporter [Xanthomonadaceae bacterium]|nr:sodium:calcium antiporter [Xanthomonadaceae bacterium]